MGVLPQGPMLVLEDRHLDREGVGQVVGALKPMVIMHTIDSRTTSIDDEGAFESARRTLESIASDAGCPWHLHFGTPSAQTVIACGEFGADLVMDVEGAMWRDVATHFDGRLCLTRY